MISFEKFVTDHKRIDVRISLFGKAIIRTSYQYLVHTYQKESTTTKVLSKKGVDVHMWKRTMRKLEVTLH